MLRRLRALIPRLAWLLALSACNTVRPAAAVLKTDETRSSLLTACRDTFADGNLRERLQKACDCLASQRQENDLAPLVRAFCDEQGGAQRFDSLVRTLKQEGWVVATNTQGQAPSRDDLECVDELAGHVAEIAVERLQKSCDAGDVNALRSLLTLPEPAAAGRCWRLRRMTADNCVVAVPCPDEAAAEQASLPVPGASGLTPAGAEVELCQPALQAIQALKDPERVSVPYNYPFANYLTHGHTSANITYGAANCHGTAQAFAGGFLADLPVEGPTYHGATVEQACSAQAQAAYDAAAAAGSPLPTGARLPIARGGYVVTMNHTPSCSPTDCGRAHFATLSCADDALKSYVDIAGMCINCWEAMLASKGFTKLAETATWRDLRPGCILTAQDHSVTTVFKNAGLCYFYESQSPFAPSLLNVSDCASLFSLFDRRWCPAEELAFSRLP